MNRRYSVAFVAELLSRIAADVPGIFLAADVIAGFPGEPGGVPGDGRGSRIAPAGVSPRFSIFSPTGYPGGADAGTSPAADASGTGSSPSGDLRRKRESFVVRFAEKELSVLVQEIFPGGGVRGLSRNYLPVTIPVGDASLVNREALVLVEETSAENCTGRILRVL